MFQVLLLKIENLEQEIEVLRNPRLMYRPPYREEYEIITDYLDEVDMRLDLLEAQE